MIRPLHLGPQGRSQTRVGQCSRIDPVTLGSWSNSAPSPYQSAIAVRQRSSAITGLTHSLGIVGSIAKVPGRLPFRRAAQSPTSLARQTQSRIAGCLFAACVGRRSGCCHPASSNCAIRSSPLVGERRDRHAHAFGDRISRRKDACLDQRALHFQAIVRSTIQCFPLGNLPR
jgi:hypothetical protein